MPFKYNNQIKAEAIRLYDDGLSALKVAAVLKISRVIVNVWARGAEVSRPINGVSSETRERCVEIYSYGWSIGVVSRLMNVCEASVSNWIKPFYTCEEKRKHYLSLMGGSNHPAWKGEKARNRLRTYCRAKHRKWSRKVRERDNYTCQLCGDVFEKGDQRLHAHHIKSILERPDIQYEFENGVSLCAKCHPEVELGEDFIHDSIAA